MKRVTIYFALFTIGLASMLSSCSLLQKGEFADRKYYNFPRSKHAVEQTASVKPEKKAVAQNTVVQEDQKALEPVVTASVNKKEVMLAKPAKVKPAVAHTVVVEESTETPAIIFKKSDIRKEARKDPRNSYRGEPALMLFLAVLASIFFPPLGIYIKDHRTNKWFWITLLLVLLGGGFFLFGPPGGLWSIAWIAAVVIALMCVFDIL